MTSRTIDLAIRITKEYDNKGRQTQTTYTFRNPVTDSTYNFLMAELRNIYNMVLSDEIMSEEKETEYGYIDTKVGSISCYNAEQTEYYKKYKCKYRVGDIVRIKGDNKLYKVEGANNNKYGILYDLVSSSDGEKKCASDEQLEMVKDLYYSVEVHREGDKDNLNNYTRLEQFRTFEEAEDFITSNEVQNYIKNEHIDNYIGYGIFSSMYDYEYRKNGLYECYEDSDTITLIKYYEK